MRTSIEEADFEANAAKDAATRVTYAGVEQRARRGAPRGERVGFRSRRVSGRARRDETRPGHRTVACSRRARGGGGGSRERGGRATTRGGRSRRRGSVCRRGAIARRKRRVETAEARLADVDARRFESERALRVSHAAVARVTEAAAVALERREGFASPSTSPAATSPSNAIASPMLRHLEIERRQRVAFRVQEGVVAEEGVAAEEVRRAETSARRLGRSRRPPRESRPRWMRRRGSCVGSVSRFARNPARWRRSARNSPKRGAG